MKNGKSKCIQQIEECLDDSKNGTYLWFYEKRKYAIYW